MERTNYNTILTFKREGRAAALTARVRGFFAAERHEQDLKTEMGNASWSLTDNASWSAIDADTLALQLCHSLESGLENDDVTAKKVAVWLLKNFNVQPRE